MTISESDEERFWEKVGRGKEYECWEWEASTTGSGYGYFFLNGRKRGAHRVSARINGMKVNDKYVLHKCDNPPCVNPNHLYVGTQQENIQDMVDRDRRDAATGKDNGNSKLTEEEAREVKRKAKAGEQTQKQIADEYGISRAQVSRIRDGKRWEYVKV